MKLNDLIAALAEEIAVVRPELDHYLSDMVDQAVDAPKFSAALKAYGEQMERMGEAAEMVGFPGLQIVCCHVADNIHLMLDTSFEQRQQFIEFLRRWPDAIVRYLHELDDSSVAADLINLLRTAPIPLEEDEALRIMHRLGAFPATMEALENEGQQHRPIIACDEDVALVIPEDAEQSLLEGFFQEAPTQTEHLITLIQNMVSNQGDISDLIAAKRIVHTLKGTGAIIGLSGLVNLGHHFEDILEYFEQNEGRVSSNVATVLLDGAYCLAQMVAYLMEADEYPNRARDVLQSILDLANSIDHKQDLERVGMRGSEQMTQATVKRPIAERAMTSRGGGVRVAMERINALFRNSAEISLHAAVLEEHTGQFTNIVKRLLRQQLRVKKRLFELETVVDVRSLSVLRSIDRHTSTISGDNFDALELEQYNELHSTTHALMEEFNDAVLLGAQLEEAIAGLTALDNRQQVLARDLQYLIMGTRMSEVGMLESRLQRNVRTTGQMTGKSVVLRISGGDTMVDTDILNQLADPLLHLLRNAVDHGIESPEERELLGKERTGTVHLAFSTRGEQIVLRCSDDGRGLNHDDILQRAIDKGLISADQTLTKDEITRLIFLPGFSTRDAVSEVSGRGIGLDVVRDWLSRMNGEMQVESEPGQGMTIVLRFASSLTTVQSLIVEVAGQPFALPTVQILQAFSHDEGRFVGTPANLHYQQNERVYAAKRLCDLLGFEEDITTSEQAFAVLVRVHDETWALAVDQLIDARELLLKPADEYISHIGGVLGTSVLGSGSIAIHLDLPQLLMRFSDCKNHIQDAALPERTINLPGVLVVDDSLSVRNALQALIEDAGYRVKTARDGIEAINVLDGFTPDVVLTDLEMPNMNGVELTTHIRSRAHMQTLPVIMITSRSQEKHRKLAMDAGVDEYFTKPYSDTALLQTISAMAGRGVEA